jgi:hypothetical protein
MHTRHPAAEIAEEWLDWFTYDIEPDGTQICAIRPSRRRNEASCSTGEPRSFCRSY